MTKGTVTFAGGVDSVTGANFLFEINGLRLLTDCGFYQGSPKVGDDKNREKFPYDPASIDVLFVTHAHIDHIGRIPKLVKEGFQGRIISTPPTRELASLMLHDTVNILKKEAQYEAKEPLYVPEDVAAAMELWQSKEYYERFSIDGKVTVEFKDAGHMLGSAMVVIETDGTNIVFTGDLGNSPAPLLRDTDPITDAKYIVMESVYGDRNHEHRDERKQTLQGVIIDTVHAGGTLVVPAFSMERTQELLYELNDMVEHKLIPRIPIYVDSPLAIKATDVYKRGEQYFNKTAKHIIESGDDIFNFPGLHFTETKEESMAIWDYQGPKMIMAGSGMANGGRIVHHLRHYLGGANNTVLLAGYQAVGTPGRMLQEGIKTVKFHGEECAVVARVLSLHGYSGHKDSDGLLAFVETASVSCKKVFLVMGEPKASLFLAQRIRDNVGIEAIVPQPGAVVDLEFGDL